MPTPKKTPPPRLRLKTSGADKDFEVLYLKTKIRREVRLYFEQGGTPDELMKKLDGWALDEHPDSDGYMRLPSFRIEASSHHYRVDHYHELRKLVDEPAETLPPAPPQPPSSLLLSMVLPATKETRDFILNMEDLFQVDWVPKHGLRWAKTLWWVQSLRYAVTRLFAPIVGALLGAYKMLKF